MSETNDTQEQPKVEIAVENFGPIAEANIDLRPLTVFVGPSNTGKTYFATLIYVLCNIINSSSDVGLLSLFDIGYVRDILNKLLNDPTISDDEIHILFNKLRMRNIPFKLSDLPIETHSKLAPIIKEIDFFREELHDELKNCFDLNSIQRLTRLCDTQHNELAILLKVSGDSQEYWNIKISVSQAEVTLESSTSLDNQVSRDTVLLPKGWSILGHLSVDENRVRIPGGSCPRIPKRYYLPAARSGIMQSHRIIAVSLVTRTKRVGLELFPEVPTLSGAVADFMEKIILYDDLINPDAGLKHIAETLENDLLAGQIRLKPSASGYPDFQYLPQGTNEVFRLSQASSMVSELAPLVLFLRGYVQPEDTLIIEEPEAHLHPGAQADMAIILARLVRAGVKVIITTHSDWLLQEIGNLILEGLIESEIEDSGSWLSPEEVGIWHFQKGVPVTEIPFHSIKGFSPKDYHDVAEGLYNRSVNLQQLYEKQGDRGSRESR